MAFDKKKAREELSKPDPHKEAKRSIKGKSGLPLLEEEAIDMIIQRDVNGMTYDEIARALNINPSTLWRWRQRKDFNDVLLKKAEEVQRNFLQDAYTSMRQILFDPKAKTHNKLKVIEMALKNQGRLKEVTENTHEVETTDMKDLLKRIEDL